MVSPCTSPLLTGKTVVITGASGLGYAAALLFLQKDVSTIVLGVRNLATAEVARTQLLADPIVATRQSAPTIRLLQLDLGSSESVVAFSAAVTKVVDAVHALILNAAVFPTRFESTPATMTFQINFASNALLTILLLPLLKKSSSPGNPSRVSFVGSKLQNKHTFGMDAPLLFQSDTSMSYGDSKMLLFLFASRIAQSVDVEQIIINTFSPGLVATNLGIDHGGLLHTVISGVRALLSQSPAAAAPRYLHAVTVADSASHGEILLNDKVEINYSPFAETPEGLELRETLWKQTLAMVEAAVPGSTSQFSERS